MRRTLIETLIPSFGRRDEACLLCRKKRDKERREAVLLDGL